MRDWCALAFLGLVACAGPLPRPEGRDAFSAEIARLGDQSAFQTSACRIHQREIEAELLETVPTGPATDSPPLAKARRIRLEALVHAFPGTPPSAREALRLAFARLREGARLDYLGLTRIRGCDGTAWSRAIRRLAETAAEEAERGRLAKLVREKVGALLTSPGTLEELDFLLRGLELIDRARENDPDSSWAGARRQLADSRALVARLAEDLQVSGDPTSWSEEESRRFRDYLFLELALAEQLRERIAIELRQLSRAQTP